MRIDIVIIKMNFKKKLQKAFSLALNRKAKKYGMLLGAKANREGLKYYDKAKSKFNRSKLGYQVDSLENWLRS